MDRAKITLSAQEHHLMMDPSVILTKNRVIGKVYALLGDCSKDGVSMFTLPPEAADILPKIAKGEAYKGLPYVMLDYPRLFTSTDVLAIRTFFWWGHYISVTLHLKGKYIPLYKQRIIAQYPQLCEKHFMLALGPDEWDHDLDGGGYIPLTQLSIAQWEENVMEPTFLKISCRFALENWDDLPQLLQETYALLGEIISLTGE